MPSADLPLFLAHPDLPLKLLVLGVVVAVYLKLAIERQGREARQAARVERRRRR
jgi:hypothetical protein